MGRKRGIQYRGGSFYRTDDRSGFVQRAENTRVEWNGLYVDTKLWEIRQPQDFVHGVADDQTVPDPRSQLPKPFVGPISTNLSANVGPGATFLPLSSIAGFSANDNVGVMLNSGVYCNAKVSGNPLPTGINISPALTGYADEGNVVTDYEAPGP